MTRLPRALFCVILAAACGSPVPADRVGGASPVPTVAAAAGPRLYVSDETGGNVVVIDAGSGQVVARVPVGKRPRGIRLSRDGTNLFVALSGSPIAGPGVDESKLPPPDRSADGIGVVDLASGRLIRTLKSGQDPESFDLSLDGTALYVSNEETAEMSIVDVATGEIRSRTKVGEEPEGVTTRPGGREVYVTSEGDGEVAAVDTATGNIVAHIKTEARPRSVTFGADGRVAFVANENAASIAVIDTGKHAVSGYVRVPRPQGAPFAPRPMGGVMSPDGRHVYISLGRAKSVAVIDVATRALQRVIDNVGERPWGIAVSADGRSLYTANGPSGDVSFIDVATGAVTKRVATGGSPWGLVLVDRR
jgi:YVTN family beta-propeller protein